MKKRDFFSKLAAKNYNNQLEEILEKKNFSSTAKNLLLSMLYKIELGYKDYENIKKSGITENQFIEKILNIIENNCNQIEIVEPNSKKGKILAKYKMSSIADEKSNTIISTPVEKEILYALMQLSKDSFRIKDKYYIINKTLPIALKTGNSINVKEVIRDFNGWSWNVEKKDIENFEYNIMFQNLRILLDYGFLYQWAQNSIIEKDYLLEMQQTLINNYGNADGEKFYEMFLILSTVFNMDKNEEIKQYVVNEQKNVSKEMKLMLDKAKFLENISQEKKKLNNQIKKIDRIINNEELLQKELEKINKDCKNKITSIETMKVILKKQREQIMEDMQKFIKLMNPKNYVSNLEELEHKEEILKKIDSNMLEDKKIIELQKIFLKCFKTKVENTKIKAEFTQLIYHFRYYKKIPISEDLLIEDIEELRTLISNVEELMIVKGVNMRVLNFLSKNAVYTIKIIKEALNSKITNLENIELEINAKYDKLKINVYDGDVIEKTFELETEGAAKKLNIKKGKKIKLFI